MALMARDTGGGNFELTPAGNHIGVCYMVCDLGEQETEWQGVAKMTRKVRISWELPGELMADGRPFSASKKYTLSLSDKSNLRADLESWRGRAFTEQELDGFDLFNVIGKACMLNVIHKTGEKGNYPVVSSIAALPKGMPAPKPVNDLVAFSLEDSDAKEKFAGLPDWLQKIINARGLFGGKYEAAHEMQRPDGNTPPVDAYADDEQIPF